MFVVCVLRHAYSAAPKGEAIDRATAEGELMIIESIYVIENINSEKSKLFEFNKDICFIVGRNSDRFLDFLRSMMRDNDLVDEYDIVNDDSNIHYSSGKVANGMCLSESDARLTNFRNFIASVKLSTAEGDDRPIFIYGLLGRIDESVDIEKLIEPLISLDRQVFLSVECYRDRERLRFDGALLIELD